MSMSGRYDGDCLLLFKQRNANEHVFLVDPKGKTDQQQTTKVLATIPAWI